MPTMLTESDILEQVVAPRKGSLPAEAARSFLRMRFDNRQTRLVRALLRKNNRGSITAVERVTLERLLRVGQLLDLLHAKAKLSLKQNAE